MMFSYIIAHTHTQRHSKLDCSINEFWTQKNLARYWNGQMKISNHFSPHSHHIYRVGFQCKTHTHTGFFVCSNQKKKVIFQFVFGYFHPNNMNIVSMMVIFHQFFFFLVDWMNTLITNNNNRKIIILGLTER